MRTFGQVFFTLLSMTLATHAQLRYACPSGEVLHVAVHKGADGKEGYAVVLVQGKPPLILRQTAAASGVKYTDGFTVLSTKGNEATIESGTVNAKACTGSMTGRQISGMFVYKADAAMFTECDTGRTVPVAMEDAYRDLERAYTEKRSGDGVPMYATVIGRIENKPKMEGSGTIPTLVVEKFESLQPGKQCTASAGPLTGKWILTQLNGQAATLPRPAFLEFPAQGGRAAGFAGCNRFTSGYQAGGQSLKFQGAAVTRMACVGPGMSLEDNFLKALNQVTAYQIAGTELKLLGSGGDLLAVLKKE